MGVLARVEVVDENNVLVKLEKPMRSMATTVWGGGMKEKLRIVLFRKVDEKFDLKEPSSYAGGVIHELGLPMMTTAVFLTAYDVTKIVSATACYEGVTAEAYVTVGLNRHPSCIALGENKGPVAGGTINLLVLVDKALAWRGIIDVFRLASEAKASLVTSMGYSCPGSPAFGTVSDALIVAAYHGNELYAGAATRVGIAVIKAISGAFEKHIRENMGLDEYLEHLMGGLSINYLVEIAAEAYKKAPVPGVGEKSFKKMFKEELEKVLEDPNVMMVIKAMRLIDLTAPYTKGVSREALAADSAGIIADELLGYALSNYINGFKGLLSYYWLERLKGKEELKRIGSLPVFTDDLITSLVGSVMSRVYDRLLSGEKRS